jgi:transcriptional regulator with XRE-family HTH domain
MINNSKFTERLKKIMDFYQLSAASFADEIDVQRSSISHLLSGRNKPSLDFVLKVLAKFETVDLYWLMNGKGSFPKKEKESATTLPKHQTAPEGLISARQPSDKEIDRIIIFYKDGTFENYMK